MTAHRIPLPDWRDALRGLPIASFNGESLKRRTMEDVIADQAKRNVLRPAPRPQIARPRSAQ